VIEDQLDLEALAVAKKHQRKGIGAALMKEFVKELDKTRSPCYLRSSVMGKSLYERFGWKVVGVFNPDLKEFGWEREYMSWLMRREGNGENKSVYNEGKAT
jgi:predicted N-acetyltransferase YhbS